MFLPSQNQRVAFFGCRRFKACVTCAKGWDFTAARCCTAIKPEALQAAPWLSPEHRNGVTRRGRR